MGGPGGNARPSKPTGLRGVIAQVGTGNLSVTSQMGSANVLGVTQ